MSRTLPRFASRILRWLTIELLYNSVLRDDETDRNVRKRPSAIRRILYFIAAFSLFPPALTLLSHDSIQSRPRIRNFPDPDVGVDSLAARKQAQLAAVSQFKVFHQFHFTDKVAESGITFVARGVEDTGRHYKAVHYDHGTGIAVADVDGDGLYDIYFVNQVGGNELWKNLGGGKFKNITDEAGVALRDRINVTASFADIDNEGAQDLYVTSVLGGNVLFKNDGQGHFTDITEKAGLSLRAHSSGAVFFDYNNDGLLDLMVCNVGKYTSDDQGPDGEFLGLADAFHGHLHPDRFEYPVLYKNLGNDKFKDVTTEVGLKPMGWCGDASFADLSGSGYPDLYLLNMQGQNHYFQNEGGQKFVDKTDEYFPKTPWGAMGIKFFDYDNDGRMDLLVTDMHSDMFQEVGPDKEKLKNAGHASEKMLGAPADRFVYGNALYHNLGGGKFEEVSDRMGVENYWPWGVSVADINADGWDDIFITSGMGFPFRYGINSMLLNNRGEKFLDAEFLLGIEPRKDGRTRAPWFAIDCSQQDLEPLNQLVCKGQSGEIQVMGTLSSRSSTIFDLDNDGDLDIVTNTFYSRPQILISNLAQVREIHWLKVVLTGTVSNRNGLGATVRVHSGGQIYMKYNDGKSGYLSQSVLPLYFGLGDSKKIDSVEVDWPSGRKQTLKDGLKINTTLQIMETK
jgi:enediyne biosynthesis protein E4